MTAKRILERSELPDFLCPRVTRELWTAVIPAAGRGSRLGFDRPKILFPVAGKTILEHLLSLLEPFCGEFIFVLSPSGMEFVEPELARLAPGRYRVAEQPEPRGMGHAVSLAVPLIGTEHVLVVWGDQVAIKPTSLESCIRLHEGPLQPQAICPTVMRTRPYIHFSRDSAGRLIRVLQAREGDSMPLLGESDSGLFLFRTASLVRYIAELSGETDYFGQSTREQNFLPILPLIDAVPGNLICPRIMTEEESVGLNSQDDARLLEKVLLGTGGRA